MSLVPFCTVTLGNLKYESQITALSADLSLLPSANQVRLTLPTGLQLDAIPGDPAKIELNGGEGSETVLTGKVHGLYHRFSNVEVWAVDGGAELGRYHPAKTYEKQAAKDIVRLLALDAGTDVSQLDMELRVAAYAAGQRRSAAEHIAYLASLDGSLASFDADGSLQVVPRSSGAADTALLYGREILACQMHQAAPPSAAQVRIGNGPAGSADAPDALRPSLEGLPDNAPDPGAEAIWRAAPVLRIPQAAKAAGEAADKTMAARSYRIRCRAFLLPRLRPGMVVEIQQMPGALGEQGPWLLRRVSHRLDPRDGAITVFEGESASASTSDLLGSLLSAAGSLF